MKQICFWSKREKIYKQTYDNTTSKWQILSVQKRKKTERSKKIKVMTHSNDTGKMNQGMTYKPEPRYSHLSLGPSTQPLPVHSPIVMETVSAVLNMFYSLLPAKLLSGARHWSTTYLTKYLSPSVMVLSTSVTISSSLSATHTSLLYKLI